MLEQHSYLFLFKMLKFIQIKWAEQNKVGQTNDRLSKLIKNLLIKITGHSYFVLVVSSLAFAFSNLATLAAALGPKTPPPQ